MKIDKKILLAGTGLLFVGTAMAQVQQKDSTLNRTVVVENQYNPEVMDAFKVNVLPKVEEPAVAKKHIDYATSMYPMTSFGFEPMGVMTREVKQEGARRGYLRGSYGMLNHTDVKAAYLWDMTKSDQLDVMASFYGHSGDVDYPLLNTEFEQNQRFFRTDFGLDYSHRFNKMKVNLGGNFGSQVFNYHTTESALDNQYGKGSYNNVPYGSGMYGSEQSGDAIVSTISRNQHFMMGNGYLGVSSLKGQLPIDFAVTVGFDAFKRKYAPAEVIPSYLQKMIFAQGTVSGMLKEQHRVGVDFGVNHLTYDLDNDIPYGNAPQTAMFENNTLIQLNPFYAIQTDMFNVRLGAHVDIQTAVGSGLKVAPDVSAAVTFSDTYVFYVQALGGTQLNDFNRLNQVSPYWNQENQMKTSYTIVDAQGGFKASPINGLGMKLYGGYRLTKDDVFVTPYGYNAGNNSLSNRVFAAELHQDKSKVFYAGLGVDYDYRDALGFGIKGQYNNWKLGNKDNIYFLALKPEFEIGANVHAKVYRGLNVLADYAYEKRKEVSGKSLDALNFLKVGAEYNYNERINVFVHANNLLNQTYMTATGYPELGINIVGGISLGF